MKRMLHRAALPGVLAVLLAAAPAFAQPGGGPTPEGTVITNTATASWTDANGNTYTPVQASVSVTVGFLAGVDVSSPATVTPASPSTGNEVSFTIGNVGNGTDQFSVSTTAAAGLTITGYRVGATTYTSLADLNAALAGTDVDMGDDITVVVIYTVAPGQGGQTMPLTLTATSVRDNTTSDASTTNVIPVVSAGVNVTPDGAAVSRLTSNGTTYSMVFVVSNTGNASDTFTLVGATSNASVLTVGTVTGTGVSGGQVVIAPGSSVDVTVTYTVVSTTEGASATLSLTATSGTDATVTDDGSLVVTVIRAAIAITKEALRANQTTVINSAGGDRVLPDESFYYRVTVTNGGTAAAQDVSVTDAIPADLVYDHALAPATANAGTWSFSWDSGTGTLTATLTGTLAPAASASFWIPVTVR